jgi:predicted dehydrogenase
MAPSSAEAERLITTAAVAAKPVSVFQNRRWDTDFLTLLRLMEGERLGAVIRIESRFERYRPDVRPEAWRERPDPEEGGGLLFDLGAHLIDQACQLFGPPQSVYAESDRRRPGALVDDDTFVALRFPSGQSAHLWASVMPQQPGPRLRVIGTRGAFQMDGLDPQEEALRTGMRPGAEHWGMLPPERWGRLWTDDGGIALDAVVRPVPGSYERFYAGMRDALVAGAPVPVDPAESLLTLRLIEAARESAATGRVQQVAPDGHVLHEAGTHSHASSLPA